MKPNRGLDWYMQPEFRNKFGRRHWWNEPTEKSQISDGAAWYELLRRHPKTAENWSKWGDDVGWDWAEDVLLLTCERYSGPTLIEVLGVIGRRCWVALTDEDKSAFLKTLAKSSLGKGRSRKASVKVLYDPTDTRHGENLEKCVQSQALRFATDMLTTSFESDGTSPASSDPSANAPAKVNSRPVSAGPKWAIVGRNWFPDLYYAIQNRRLVLVAELCGDDPKEAAQILANLYLNSFEKANGGKPQGLVRAKNWLATIAEFETSEDLRLRTKRGRGEAAKKAENQTARQNFSNLFKGIEL